MRVFLFTLLASFHLSAQELKTVTIQCPLFSQEEAKQIQGSCSLINDDDFARLYKQCQKNAKQTGGCASKSEQIDDLITELRTDSVTQNYNDYAAGGATRALDKMERILSGLEAMKSKDKCKPGSLAYKVLPLVSAFNSPLAFALGSGAQLFSRAFKLLQEDKDSYGDKINMCQANAYMRDARSLACQQAVGAKQGKHKADDILKDLNRRTELGKNSHAFTFLSTLKIFQRTVARMTKGGDDKNIETDDIRVAQTMAHLSLEKLNCSQKKAVPQLVGLCTDLKDVHKILQEENFDWRKDSALRREYLNKIGRFASQDFYKKIQEIVLSETGVSWNTKYRNGAFYREAEGAIDPKKPIPTFNESAEKVHAGLLAFYHTEIADLKAPLDASRKFILSSQRSAEQLNSALELLPDSFERMDAARCSATSCIWAAAPKETAASSGEIKNLHEYGWNALERQNLSTLMSGGRYFQAWQARLKDKSKPLQKIFDSCGKQSSTCQVSCKPPFELENVPMFASPAPNFSAGEEPDAGNK